MTIPTINDINAAHERIRPFIHRTPVLSSGLINNAANCNISFKCENFQKVGAFKYRGATNTVSLLNENERKNGVATHSSGNHAQALALAARTAGIPATIVMPDNSPEVKKKAVAGYGAEIVFCEPTLEARESTLKKVIEKANATEIHPYNNFNVISGQGTASIELLEDITQKPDIIMTPVGGGGLLSGTAIAVKETNPEIKIIAAEPEGADDAFRSFQKGSIIPSQNPNTICDGLLTSLGEINFEIIQKYVDEVVLVRDEFVIKAMKLMYERMKIVVEPSGAITLGAVLQYPEKFKDANIGAIISGGNIDLRKLGEIFA